MKIKNYKPPLSRFLSVDKDIARITELLYSNDRLCRLLYRTDLTPIEDANLTPEEKVKLFQHHYIRTLPRVTAEEQPLNYIVVNFDNFVPTSNPEFRDNTIIIGIFCHFDQWNIDGSMMRPYRIAAEVDTMLSNAKLSGIGTLQFISGRQLFIEDSDYGGLELVYIATHGGDDTQHFENLANEIAFLEEELSEE